MLRTGRTSQPSTGRVLLFSATAVRVLWQPAGSLRLSRQLHCAIKGSAAAGFGDVGSKPERGAAGHTEQRARRKPVSKAKQPVRSRQKAISGPRRLAKVLAEAGVASRRASEELIQAGKVTVNGQVVTIPQTLVNHLKDLIRVNNRALPQRKIETYIFALNKPKGYLCANSVPDGSRQRLAIDLLQEWVEQTWKPDHKGQNALPPRFFTVGRLDAQTTGLIFVTNDGQWAQSVQHPSSGLTREYIVTTTAPLTAKQLDTIAAGCEVDGAFVRPKTLSLMAEHRNKFRVVVSEGRNREVRTLAANAGLEVQYLKRVRIGGYRLNRDLGIGEVKLLKPWELRSVTDKSQQT